MGKIELTYQPYSQRMEDGCLVTRAEGWIARIEGAVAAWGRTRKSAYMRAYRIRKKIVAGKAQRWRLRP